MKIHHSIWRNRETEQTIADIRAEVAEQKKCVTNHMLQAVVFAGAIWGIALRNDMSGNRLPLFICGGFVVLIMVMIGRMANHKYGSMNRNLGYELHLQRISDYIDAEAGSNALAHRMVEMGWEEAMCAYRIVQPTLFEHPYHRASISLLPYRTRKGHRRKDGIKYRWYDTKSLLPKEADYHPGNYLRNVHGFLGTVAVVSVVIMAYFFCIMSRDGSNVPQPSALAQNPIRAASEDGGSVNIGKHPIAEMGIATYIVTAATSAFVHLGEISHQASPRRVELIFSGAILFLAFAYLVSQWLRHRSFRLILESELLSIQSCAVVWRVVSVCHILATEISLARHKCYRRYTTYMALLAIDFNLAFYHPHDWLKKWEELAESDQLFEEFDLLIPEDKVESICSDKTVKTVRSATESRPPPMLWKDRLNRESATGSL